MMYPYATFNEIEIVHSDLQGHGIVTVYCERDFHTAQFALPGCECLTSKGFSKKDLQELEQFVATHEQDILRKATKRTLPHHPRGKRQEGKLMTNEQRDFYMLLLLTGRSEEAEAYKAKCDQSEEGPGMGPGMGPEKEPGKELES